jgi:hypothetical protein
LELVLQEMTELKLTPQGLGRLAVREHISSSEQGSGNGGRHDDRKQEYWQWFHCSKKQRKIIITESINPRSAGAT